MSFCNQTLLHRKESEAESMLMRIMDLLLLVKPQNPQVKQADKAARDYPGIQVGGRKRKN